MHNCELVSKNRAYVHTKFDRFLNFNYCQDLAKSLFKHFTMHTATYVST